MRKKLLFPLLMVVSIAAVPSVLADEPAASPQQMKAEIAIDSVPSVTKFDQVSAVLYRSAQPSYKGLQELKKAGIKTIISLRHNRTQFLLEKLQAERLGMKFEHLPLDGIHKPKQETIQKFFEIVRNPANQPCLVHCEFGMDRTGCMVAIYRQEEQKWTAKAAYDEMVRKGFEKKYAWLADAVFDYEEDKLGTLSSERPLSVKMLDSVETAIGTRPSMKTRTAASADVVH